MFMISLTIKLVVPCGLYKCGSLYVFQNFYDREPTSSKTLGLYVVHSLRMMPFDNLMSFFLGLVDKALVHLYLRPDFVHISTWNHILASS